MQYLNYNQAKTFCITKNIISKKQYLYFLSANNVYLPRDPEVYYKNDWKGWSDFLAIESKPIYDENGFYTYNQAKKVLFKYNIKNTTHYRQLLSHKQIPCNIPTNPKTYYGNQFISYDDFFGTHTRKPHDFLDYDSARQYVSTIENINNYQQYVDWSDRPSNIPINPDIIYKNQWVSWREFLNINIQTNNKMIQKLDYQTFKSLVNNYKITSKNEYMIKYHKISNRLPKQPDLYFGPMWKGWNDVFQNRTNKFVDLETARQLCKQNNINNQVTYKANYKSIGGLPSNPLSYKVSWSEFFNKTNKPNRTNKFVDLETARQLCKQNNFNNQRIYIANYKSIAGLPSDPISIYKVSWCEFFNKPKKPNKFVDLETARQLCKQNNFNNQRIYIANYKSIAGLPSDPSRYYEVSWKEFFNKSQTSKQIPKVSKDVSELLNDNIDNQDIYNVINKSDKSIKTFKAKYNDLIMIYDLNVYDIQKVIIQSLDIDLINEIKNTKLKLEKLLFKFK